MKKTENSELRDDRAQRIENLVMEIKGGKTDLIQPLWSEIEDLCNWYCRKLYRQLPEYFLLEYEDLTQCGYLALVEALQHYDIGGTGRFSNYYCFYLVAAVFRENGLSNGGHYPDGRRRFDPVIDEGSVHIDAETDQSEEKPGTLHGVLENEQVDYSGAETISSVIDAIYREQLHAVLEMLIEDLPQDERILIRKKYYAGVDRNRISEELGVSKGAAVDLETRALIDLRQRGRVVGLEQFLDSQIDYYRGTGWRRFAESGTSPVERITMQRFDLEQRYYKVLQNHKESFRKDK